MANKAKKFFDADVFLATADGGRTISQYEAEPSPNMRRESLSLREGCLIGRPLRLAAATD
jgi:hypothetical protein